MAVQVYTPPRPQRKSSGGDGGLFGKVAQIGGAVAGMALGGPAGAQQGFAAGGMLAGLTQQDNSAPRVSAGPETVQTGNHDAINRRLQSLNQNPLKQIGDSINSLQYVQNPETRQELAKPLLQAQYVAMNKKQG